MNPVCQGFSDAVLSVSCLECGYVLKFGVLRWGKRLKVEIQYMFLCHKHDLSSQPEWLDPVPMALCVLPDEVILAC